MAITSSLFKGATDSMKRILNTDPELLPLAFEYASPADVKLEAQETIALFLYSIVPNAYMRNTGPTILNRDANSVDIRAQDVILDLHFMITAYGPGKESEFGILERVIQVLHDNPVISGDHLSVGLVENENSEVRIEPVNIGMDDLNKLWSIFPQKSYRLSVFYQLTPVRMISSRIESAKAARGLG